MSHRVAFISVTYFGSSDAIRLATSLRQQSDGHWRLILVDNSQDSREEGLLRTLASSDPRIAYLSTGRNAGYFAGAAAGLDRLGPKDAWTAVCNADVEFAPDVVGRLLRTDPNTVGVLGPSIISTISDRDQNPYMRERPTRTATLRRDLMFRSVTVARILVALASVSGRLKRSRRSVNMEPQRIYAPHGSCMFFSSAYFAAGGTLHHPVFLFGEEVTVAESCRRLDLPIVYAPRIRVRHQEHQSTGAWRSSGVLKAQRDAALYTRELLSGGQ